MVHYLLLSHSPPCVCVCVAEPVSRFTPGSGGLLKWAHRGSEVTEEWHCGLNDLDLRKCRILHMVVIIADGQREGGEGRSVKGRGQRREQRFYGLLLFCRRKYIRICAEPCVFLLFNSYFLQIRDQRLENVYFCENTAVML